MCTPAYPADGEFVEGKMNEPMTASGAFHPFVLQKPRRRRLNLQAILQVMALPFAVFATTIYLFGFGVRNSAAVLSFAWLGLCVILSVAFLSKAYKLWKKQWHERWTVPWYLVDDDDTWFLFLGVAVLVSCMLGLAIGQVIYAGHMQNYYMVSSLPTFAEVDPTARGRAYENAAAISFKEGSIVDVAQARGYKDETVYCVAPVKLGTDPAVNADFWVAGKNCCTGLQGDFDCFDDHRDRLGHGGVRILENEDTEFYRLAQSQANADGRFNIVNPVFVTWSADPIDKIDRMYQDAVSIYRSSLTVFVLFEAAIVSIVAYSYWKNRLWG